MAKFIDKMMDMMKLSDYEDDGTDEDYEYEDNFNSFTGEPEPVKETASGSSGRSFKSYNGGRSKVMNLQANVQMEVVVIQPSTYDEAQEICDHIKSKKPSIINLEKMEHNIAQRIMDFVSGACYTLDGNMQRVTNNIFLIAPQNVDILGNFSEELKENGIINWEKY